VFVQRLLVNVLLVLIPIHDMMGWGGGWRSLYVTFEY